MAIDLKLTPKQKRPVGEPCCEPVAYPDVERDEAERLAIVAKALGDPTRLQLVDVLRKHAGKVCVCELPPSSRWASRPSRTTSRCCATRASWTPSAAACGPTTTSSPMRSPNWAAGWEATQRKDADGLE